MKQRSVLVIGSGGREHALAWKLSQSPQVKRVVVAPGNDAMDPAWECWPVKLAQGKPAFNELALKARDEKIDLVVVGPDNPLADGIVDTMQEAGLTCFGPSASAARIEASKAFAKEVMSGAGVPTARYKTVGSLEEARAFLSSAPWGAGWVIKADGLALGKGVQVCVEREEALRAAEQLILISGSLVIEERLVGEELSWMAFCDGERCALLEPARDFKRVGDGDQGPNTGGMGAFSPVPGVPEGFAERIRNEVFLPTLRELARRGAPFRGLLYAGLMADFARDRYWVLELNARFGDPETQVLMPRIVDDLYDWCEASALGKLDRLPSRVGFSSESAVVVVGAAKGYPENPEKGAVIRGLQPASPAGGELHFVAGASRRSTGAAPEWVTSGGGVFGAVGMGSSLEDARKAAYLSIERVSFEGMHYRKDIALAAAQKEQG